MLMKLIIDIEFKKNTKKEIKLETPSFNEVTTEITKVIEELIPD